MIEFQFKGEPPPQPPRRYEMIEALKKHHIQRQLRKFGIYGPVEDFDNMANAALWKRYLKWCEFVERTIVF